MMCDMLTSFSIAAACSKSPKRFSPALRAALHVSNFSAVLSLSWRSSCASAEAAPSRSRLSFSAAWQPCRVFRAPAASALAACASAAPSLAACEARSNILIRSDQRVRSVSPWLACKLCRQRKSSLLGTLLAEFSCRMNGTMLGSRNPEEIANT